MSSYPPLSLNPLSIGQFVNNATIPSEADDATPKKKMINATISSESDDTAPTKETRLANVAYCEMSFRFPEEIRPEWLQVYQVGVERDEKEGKGA